MRRSSFVVLLAAVTAVLAVWTGASVLAQPVARARNTAGAQPSADHNPFRSLIRGGYLPGSATRAPSGRATVEGAASDRPGPGAATRPRPRSVRARATQAGRPAVVAGTTLAR